MTEQQAIVYIVDDDVAVREALEDLLRSVGLVAMPFGSAKEFLESSHADVPACIVLDIRLPGQSGLEFQRTLTDAGILYPIIFISGHGDIAMSVRAMKSGAVEFLTKPVGEQPFLDAVQSALERDRGRRRDAKIVAELQERHDSLTPREREVLALVVAGSQNKQIAAQLGLSVMTVKVHRSQLTRKMGAKSVIELVRMADRLGIAAAAKPKH